MVILDTNVVSELMRSNPEPKVVDWFDRLPAGSSRIPATTVMELYRGVRIMPEGIRRSMLTSRVEITVKEFFRDRIATFGEAEAERAGAIIAELQARGRVISVQDAQIAATCAIQDALLATRNIKDFKGTGVEMVNPWEV